MSMRAYLAVLAGCLLFASPAAAEKWPSQPIRVILTGSSDVAPRAVGEQISKWLGQRVILEIHPGASGIIAADYVLKQPANGYTFLNASSALAASAYTFKQGFDLTRDFAPVCLDGTDPFILVVHPDVPAHSVAELIALAKKHPGELNFSATSNGSSSDLVAELFKSVAHIDMVHVPYKAMRAALIAVMGGHVQVGITVGAISVGQIKAHKLRALAVTTAKRSPVLPDIPTFRELGYPIVLPGWNGIIAKKGTPPSIIARMNREMVKALQVPAVRKALEKSSLDPAGDTPQAFGAFIKDNMTQWGRAARAAHLKKKKTVHRA